MTKEELLNLIKWNQKPKDWRKGQFIFNWIDCNFSASPYESIARNVQFIDGIDCFYDDSKIDEFLDACVKRINEL